MVDGARNLGDLNLHSHRLEKVLHLTPIIDEWELVYV